MTNFVQVEVQQRLFNQRAHNRIMNDLNRETVTLIRDTCLPFHFMTAAYNRYPGVFAVRSKRWQLIKARTVHHQRPNEWTGALRLAVLLESKISATADHGRLEAKAPTETKILSGPRAGQMIRRPLTEQRRKEMEHVSESEIADLAERQRAKYIAAIYDPANQTKVLKQYRG